eukprot:13112363-Alexandrium_andersonii.AAC.1
MVSLKDLVCGIAGASSSAEANNALLPPYPEDSGEDEEDEDEGEGEDEDEDDGEAGPNQAKPLDA